MTYQRLEQLADLVKKISNWSLNAFCFILALPIQIAVYPFLGIWYGCKWLYKRFLKKKVDEEIKPKIKPHITPQPNTGWFLFKEHGTFDIPEDKIAFIANNPNSVIDNFFNEDKDWLQYWQDWYGLDIIRVEPELIHEGMVYPEDFSTFRHGFLWLRHISTSDKVNNDKTGYIAYYFELDPNSEKPMREQMKDIANKIYNYYFDI